MKKDLNLHVGDIYGYWEVIDLSNFNTFKHPTVKCRCKCGTVRNVQRSDLVNKKSLSCGCNHENAVKKHGYSHTRLHKEWVSIRQRCNNPNNQDYEDYGSRGIKLCDEWQSDFMPFKEWALSNGYQDTLEIDRIDNNGNYEPSNCRWVTHDINTNNRRNVHQITAFGETKTISEWAIDPRCKIGRWLLYLRLRKKWRPELALTKPKKLYSKGG